MTLKPLNKEEHQKIAKDIAKAVDILSPHLERLWKAYGVNCKAASLYQRALKNLTSDFCNEIDYEYFKLSEQERNGEKSPWYNSGIVHYN